jgi:membrane associated rhomboid family serine protease
MRQAPKWTEFPHYPVIAGTALLAVGVTVASWAKMDVSPLVENAMVRRGELWRLVTSMFPHVGALHLIFNIYWLWVFGTLIEQVYGHIKTAALIILLAAGSNALEYAFASGGVGLSGVDYGLFGLLWVVSGRDERFRDAVDRNTVQLFVVWFFLCIVLTITNVMRVGNIAHGTGAVLGALVGWTITQPERRFLAAASACSLTLFGLWAATAGRPKINLSGVGAHDECFLGYTELQADHKQEAMAWFREAVRYRNVPRECWTSFGVANERLHNYQAALAAYRKASEMDDDFGEYNLGTLYARGAEGVPQDDQQALNLYRKAADHGDPTILNNVAWEFATSSNPVIRNPEAALKYATQAVASDKDHPNPMFLDTLAEAQYVNGHFQNAVKTEMQAIALASAKEKTSYQKSLEKYQLAAQSVKSQIPRKDN